jgi:hypothetical protein
MHQIPQAHGYAMASPKGFLCQRFQSRGMSQTAAEFPCEMNVFHAPSVSFTVVTPPHLRGCRRHPYHTFQLA